jgi:hypothetical protein
MTTPLVKRCRADDKGNLVIPLGAAEAGVDVEVVIRPASEAPDRDTVTQEEWRDVIERTSGRIDGAGFRRPPQPEVPARVWDDK